MRINRKFYVFGQFTRYVRPGYQMVAVDDENSVAAYDRTSHKLVVVDVTGDTAEEKTLDLSRFSVVGDTVQLIATTTDPGSDVPDWKQHAKSLKIENRAGQKLVSAHLYPRSVYTFLVEAVLR